MSMQQTVGFAYDAPEFLPEEEKGIRHGWGFASLLFHVDARRGAIIYPTLRTCCTRDDGYCMERIMAEAVFP